MPFKLLKARDTGEWDVTALCGDRVDQGKLTVQRAGETTWIMAENLRLAVDPAGGVLDLLPQSTLPQGLRPSRSRWQSVITATGAVRRLAVSSSGWVPLYSSPRAGDLLHFTVGIPTPGPMPTTIPGVRL